VQIPKTGPLSTKANLEIFKKISMLNRDRTYLSSRILNVLVLGAERIFRNLHSHRGFPSTSYQDK
jgi:hypothetical protein